MADNPPQNRQQRRAAKFGHHRVDARDAHDAWPASQPNPALGDKAAAEGTDQDQSHPTSTGRRGDVTEPDGTAAEQGSGDPKSEPTG